eukprot:6044300-Alexandrium_andersonii.AAC.1
MCIRDRVGSAVACEGFAELLVCGSEEFSGCGDVLEDACAWCDGDTSEVRLAAAVVDVGPVVKA